MRKLKKCYRPQISLPATLTFEDEYYELLTVQSEDFSADYLIDINGYYEGFRLSGDISGFGTVAFDIKQNAFYTGIIENYVETVDNYNVVDTANLVLSEESLNQIEMRLPDKD